MYTLKALDAEIVAKVEWLEANNGIAIHKKALVEMIQSDHEDIKGEDADFALCCVYDTVSDRVEVYFRNVKVNESESSDGQMLLPGFKHLQKRYNIQRDSESVLVRIQDMTDAEIGRKESELRMMAIGLMAHADELHRFLDERAQGVLPIAR